MMNHADFAVWPERFVYVCSASQAATVNQTPMMQAGGKRVAAVVVLCAITDPDSPTAADKAHAIQPTERLMDYAIRVLGLDESRFRVVQGHPDSFDDWKNVLNAVYDVASELNCDIIFNISAGRTACRIAPLIGFEDPPAPPTLKIIAVGFSPFRVDIVEFDGENRIVQGTLPIEKMTSIRDYLKSYGIVEIDRGGRMELQDRMIGIFEFANRFLRIYCDLGEGPLRWAMKSAMKNLQTEANTIVQGDSCDFPKIVSIEEKTMAFLDRHGLLSGLDGLEINEGTSLVVDKFAAEVLAGKWLEAVVYSQLDKELSGRNEVEYGCGIRLALEAKDKKRKRQEDPMHRNELTDLDCVILANDRFDIIEVKAVTVLKGFRSGIVRLSEYSRMLSGQAGRAWLVAPFIDSDEAKKKDMISHASQMGVELLVGPDAVGILISKLRERRP